MRSLSGRAPYRRQDGAVAVLVALMLVVLMAAVALAVDSGGLYLRRRSLVNGADAAALAAARTCERGGDDSAQGGYPNPEAAADDKAAGNAGITLTDAQSQLNTSFPAPQSPQCGSAYGRVSVQYTAQQPLYFAPVLGFGTSSPVTTAATASWGLGSVNAVPLIMSSQLLSTCPQPPPTGTNVIGQPTCGIWYDNDTLNNGNFGFLSLNPEGWDVPPGDVPSDCTGAGTGGSNILGDWIAQRVPTSLVLNWTQPTYVCSMGGLKGNSNPWAELDQLANIQAIRDFPITWEGPGSPGFGAPAQGYVLHSGNILKYDVIGFAALKIRDVLTVQEAGGSSQTTQQPWPTSNYTYNPTGITLQATLPSGSAVSYTWNGHRTTGQHPASGGTCAFQTSADRAPGTYTWQNFGGSGNQCPSGNDVLDGPPAQQPTQIAITYPVTVFTPGPCGPVPAGGGSGNGNSSARCLLVDWMGSTLTGDYSQPQDNLRVIRLCDPDLGNCLDQRHGAP
jgi:Flp pilus assembly protein TadG